MLLNAIYKLYVGVPENLLFFTDFNLQSILAR